MKKSLIVLSIVAASVSIVLAVAQPSAAGVIKTSSTRCQLAAFASGELVVSGVSCKTGAKIIKRALRKPGCTPSREDAENGRGCYGSTKVSGWRCTGLFPGEGFDLRCKKGKRRIHGGAGG